MPQITPWGVTLDAVRQTGTFEEALMVSNQRPSAVTPQQSAKSKSKTDLRIEEAIARLVAEAPPLSPGQRARIAELFVAARPGRRSNQRSSS
jgi:hypothetical protein